MSYIAQELDGASSRTMIRARPARPSDRVADASVESSRPCVGESDVGEWHRRQVGHHPGVEKGDCLFPRAVFARECETFRVMGWPIRLRQTFHVRKKGFGFVVLKAVTERL